MRAVALVAAAASVLVVPGALAAPPPAHPVTPITIAPVGSLVVQASPSQAGARPVQLRLTMRTELQCGRLTGGAIVVSFPAAERMPGTFGSGDVLVNGKPLGASLAGHVVSISLPKVIGPMCDVIGPGTVSVVFTKSARLGNPSAPGTYHVTMRVRESSAVASFVVA
jgi:hypothetical protein